MITFRLLRISASMGRCHSGILASALPAVLSMACSSAPSGSDTSGGPGPGGSATSGDNGASMSSNGSGVGSGVNGRPGGSASSGAPSSGSAVGTGTGAGVGSPDGGSSASSGAGSPLANDPNTATLTMTSFTVGPGQEVFMCQDFTNPFGGVDAAIGRSESDMTPGSHHLHLFYGADSPPNMTAQVCANPFEFRSVLHIAGTPTLVTQYPTGMAAKLKGTLGLRLQVHYVNAGSTTVQASVKVKLTKVDPSTVKNWVAELYFNRTVLSVPPGTGQTVTTTCTDPSTFGPIGLIGGGSHMHSRGVHFVATTNKGVSLIDTTQWDAPPPVTYDPPLTLNPGDSITWTCTYDNMTGSTLTFGDSALKNEMCIYVGRYYSSPTGDDIECQSTSPNGAGAVTNNVPH